MIIFLENGRIGNQLFQYSGLRHLFPGHKLFFVGCESLQRNFDEVNAIFISRKIMGHWIPLRLFRSAINLLVATCIVGRVEEVRAGKKLKIKMKRGLLWNIHISINCYFQHNDIINKYQTTPRLKQELIQAAHKWLEKKRINLNKEFLVFVHVRRGDYLSFPSGKYPAVLNLDWYKRGMKHLGDSYRNTTIIYMGDDQHYLRDVFEESDKVFISDNTPEIDLALMSLCHSGILSASTFAWWGAFFARANQGQEGTFLAPKYWGGHRAKKWYPSGFITNWMTYLDT